MNNTKMLIALVAIIFVAALTRLVDHPYNFTPIVAILLFSAFYFKSTVMKIMVPLSVLLISDFFLELKTGFGFHSGTWVVYGSFLIILIVASSFFKKRNFTNIALFSVLGSSIFFLITNFALFYPAAAVPNIAIGAYPHNLTGIIASYEAGLPFFRNMLAGDLLYTFGLFGAYSLVEKVFNLEKFAV